MYKGVLLFAAGAIAGVSLSSLPQQPQTIRDFPNLRQGLLATPGCLGVQTFTTDNGKQLCIAGWFENRKAMEAWYYSPMHQESMAKFFPGFGGNGKRPFASFKDENAPMLVVASVTAGDKPIGHGSNLAISQIAIEAYTPVPGGLAIGGTFAPEKLQVPGLVRLRAGG